MKKIITTALLSISVFLMVLLTGCGGVDTFTSVTDSENFATVPLMAGENISFSEVTDVGGGDYQIWAYNTSFSDYQSYLTLLEENGFQKYVDNGESGIEGYVYAAHYTKDNLLVSANYFTNLQSTTITVNAETNLSDHLFYKDEYVAKNTSDSKTTLSMLELYTAGNSFVFQLKDGSFIVNDGGYEEDLPYLLDYLEAEAPEGQKPVVAVWIISHAHIDHMGPLAQLAQEHPEWADRIYLDNIYFTEASAAALETTNASASALTFYGNAVGQLFKSSTGGSTNTYRMRQGERYYFNDITMDVVYEQSILHYKEWKTFNSSSTVLMYTIEGQKVFMTADMDYEVQMKLLDIYDDDYFNIAVYQTPHHGGNVYNQFSHHLTLKTVLYARANLGTSAGNLQARWSQRLHLMSKAEETLDWGTGGVRLTFPYEVGTYEKLPSLDWKYHKTPPSRYQTD